MAKNLAVLGSPIDHSLSPQIHEAAYSLLALDWEYARQEVKEGELSPLLTSLDDSWLGLSLTMPLKSEAFDVSQQKSEDAQLTQLANTLVRRPYGWQALNTDVQGLKLALGAHIAQPISSVLIIGSGATAKSAILASTRAFPHAEIAIAARNVSSVQLVVDWAASLGLEVHTELISEIGSNVRELTISTIPGSGQPELLDCALADFQPTGTLFDIAYSPWPSAMAQKWSHAGLQIISGVEMLLQQALLQIDSFLDAAGEPPIDDREAVIAAMRAALAAH